MFLPAGKKLFLCKIKLFPSFLPVLTQQYSTTASKMSWETEKERLLKMSTEERRERFPSKDAYVPVDSVEPWRIYTISNKNLESKKPTLDDVTEFKKKKLIKKPLTPPQKSALFKVPLLEKVAIYKGDITKLEVDAIVNAANSLLKRGGGVDGAIHRAAGPLLQQECNTLGGCPTGQARITGGYNLPAKYVIHTVGPQDGDEGMLQMCYDTSLGLVEKYKLKTVAFPCISTGIYGFPNRLAAHIALRTARQFLENYKDMYRIIFCTFMPIDIEIYETLMQMYFPIHEMHYADGPSVTES